MVLVWRGTLTTRSNALREHFAKSLLVTYPTKGGRL